jgi:hypothetical protein
VVGTFVAPTQTRGDGLFLREDGTKGSFVGVLDGKVVGCLPLKESASHGYVVQKKNGELVDTSHGGYCKKINHSCIPNCKLDEVTLPDGSTSLVVRLKNDTSRLSELTFDYGSLGRPSPCYCAQSADGHEGCSSKNQSDAEDHGGGVQEQNSPSSNQVQETQSAPSKGPSKGPWNLCDLHPSLWLGSSKHAEVGIDSGDFTHVLNLGGNPSSKYKAGLGKGNLTKFVPIFQYVVNVRFVCWFLVARSRVI